jgi:hypothetical protein
VPVRTTQADFEARHRALVERAEAIRTREEELRKRAKQMNEETRIRERVSVCFVRVCMCVWVCVGVR